MRERPQQAARATGFLGGTVSQEASKKPLKFSITQEVNKKIAT
jgi:hypothetical protein